MIRFLSISLGLWLLGTAAALDLADPVAAEGELTALVEEWESAWKVMPDAANSVGLATSLHALGVIERQLAKPDAAVAHLRRACNLLEAHSPKLLGDAREALALALQDQGEFAEGEKLLLQVLETRRERGADPVALALTLDHLALSLLLQGRYTEVSSILRESLAHLPDSHPIERARITGHLGRYHHTLGSHARAMDYFDDALEIDFKEPELRLSLRSQRALAQLRLGFTAEAVAATESVAEDARALLADTPVRAIPYLNNLGAMSLSLGRPTEAAQAFREARELVASALGDQHPSLAGIHHNLGVALQQSGALAEARTELLTARELQRLHLPEIHLRVAETQRELAVNAILSEAPDAASVGREASAITLELLERLVESGSETERLNFIERFNPLSLPCALGDADLIADTLLASKARLLDSLMGANPTSPPRWQDISESLPSGSAFIDFCRYQPIRADATERYGAVLVVADRGPIWIELAESQDLQRWLEALKKRLSWNTAQLGGEESPPPSLTMAGVLGFLHQQFWAPIDQQIPEGVRHLAVSPDGATHFLPLPVLIDSDGEILCRRYDQITRVASGRDLLDSRELPKLGESPWTVLTISDYPRPSPTDTETTLLGETLRPLGPLPGTAAEAKAIRKAAPHGSRFLSDHEVTETALAQLPASPGVLHFGGHAFFMGGERSDAPVDFDLEPDQLLSTGLVLHRGLASSHAVPGRIPDDDLLFPGEIAGLPLNSTRLVTLSSCDSGLGTSVDGEGVLGLQRAFAIAGAREVMVALWPVSDSSTPDFMRRFYALAKQSDRSAQSLWQTQAELIPSPDHPEFEQAVLRYAPFCLSQNHALHTGPPIELKSDRSAWWLALIIGIPGALWLAIRSRARPTKERKALKF